MKKIITSIGMIVFVGALIVGGTGAFFSDTETSTGNVFTAGAIDLRVDSEQHYNNMVCTEVTAGVFQWKPEVGFTPLPGHYPVPNSTCDGTWAATNLGAHKFFNFDDIKPGDEGENTISLHVSSNEAYACVDVNITSNDDVDCTEPETEAEIAACQNSLPSAEFDGELAQNMDFFAWLDDGNIDGFGDEVDPGEGDNIWQAGESPLFSNIIGPASDALDGESYTLADPQRGALVASTTYYIGFAWCAGNMTTAGPGLLDCDGSTMGNEAQTDEMIADIAFRVEQARHNEDFSCAPRTAPTTATITVDKVVTFTSGAIAGVDVPDFALSIDHTDAAPAIPVTDQVAVAGLQPGTYTISEVYSNDPANVTFDAVFTGACSEIGVTNTGTMTVVAGDNAVCTITNSVSPEPIPG
jgi:predicted ribosomally synthesized peptide with SipW-like signal peptide